MSDRFDLEQSILNCWHIVDDIDLLYKNVCENDQLSKDDIANVLLGIKTIYNMRFDETFRQFEDCIKNQEIK